MRDNKLAEYIDRLPKDAQADVQAGIPVLHRIAESPAQFNMLTEMISAESANLTGSFNVGALSKRLALSIDDTGKLMSLGLFIGGLVANADSEADVIRAMLSANMMSKEDEVDLLRLIKAASEAGIAQAVRKGQLANEILPSLRSFDATVDVRVSFAPDGTTLSVPVLIAALSTDYTAQRIWFQVTKGKLHEVIDELNDRLKDMERAEDWAAQQEKGQAPKR